MDNTKYVKKNYRQTGRKLTGTILKGRVLGNPFSLNKSNSIPTKYETVLRNTDTRVGFGSNRIRFGHSGNENPGPGQYTEEKPDSISNVRGCSSMLYKSKKFCDQDKEYINIAPGPGDFSHTDYKLQKKMDKNYIMFAGRERQILHDEQFKKIKEVIDHPDPGHYDVDMQRKLEIQKNSKENYYFKDSTYTRDVINKHQLITPHVHQYNHLNDKSELIGKDQREGYRNWMFSDRIEKRVPINLYDPTTAITVDADPGPGHYDNLNVERKVDMNVTNRNHYFQIGETDRFGKPTVRKKADSINPGPGHYNIEPKNEGKTMCTINNNVIKGFESYNRTQMHPGPAYYDNTPSKNKKTYHFNTKQVWM